MDNAKEFTKKYKEIKSELEKYISKRISNLHDAEDILQDTSLLLIEKANSYNIDDMLVYAKEIAKNLIRNYNRKNNNKSTDELNQNISKNDNIDYDIIISKDLINQLPAIYQTTIQLYAEGYSAHDIATHLKLSDKTISNRITKCKNILKKIS